MEITFFTLARDFRCYQFFLRHLNNDDDLKINKQYHKTIDYLLLDTHNMDATRQQQVAELQERHIDDVIRLKEHVTFLQKNNRVLLEEVNKLREEINTLIEENNLLRNENNMLKEEKTYY